jgi:putative ATPase
MSFTPLADRVRPRHIQQFEGQSALLGNGGVLRRLIETKSIHSMILWGPPGTGKTTLAGLLARSTDRPLEILSAVDAGVRDIRQLVQRGKGLFPPVLFVDEIHRFNKAQQDALLPAVENGTLTLIGATTENPSFEVIQALLSRCQVYVLEPLSADELLRVVDRALREDVWLREREVVLEESRALLRLSGGDARRLLNLLEVVVQANHSGSATALRITDSMVEAAARHMSIRYDRLGEQHYDLISALIKSVRGGDPNAAVYYLARMIAGGEDLVFIARRMMILASEDIGHAQPMALMMAVTASQAVERVGNPESRIILSQLVTYLACCPKSNSAYLAIEEALRCVHETGNLEVPLDLRNAPTRLMKELGYGQHYVYSHDGPGNFVEQDFMPEEISRKRLFLPGDNPREREMLTRLRSWWGDRYGYEPG